MDRKEIDERVTFNNIFPSIDLEHAAFHNL